MTQETVIVASTLIIALYSICAVALQGTKQFFLMATADTVSLLCILTIMFSGHGFTSVSWAGIVLFLHMQYTWYMKADDVTFGPFSGLIFEMVYNAKKKQVESMEDKKVVDIS